jgi:hypothetical protein
MYGDALIQDYETQMENGRRYGCWRCACSLQADGGLTDG